MGFLGGCGLLMAGGTIGFFLACLVRANGIENRNPVERTCPYRSNISCDTVSDDQCGDCEVKQ